LQAVNCDLTPPKPTFTSTTLRSGDLVVVALFSLYFHFVFHWASQNKPLTFNHFQRVIKNIMNNLIIKNMINTDDKPVHIDYSEPRGKVLREPTEAEAALSRPLAKSRVRSDVSIIIIECASVILVGSFHFPKSLIQNSLRCPLF
jgi:hypothetical protein